MRSPIVWVVGLLGLLACGGAQRPTCTPATVAGPYLWVVDGMRAPTYFFGTIHAGGRKLIPEVALAKLRASSTFVAELDLDHVDAQALLARGRLPEGESLDALLGPALFEKLAARTSATVPAFLLRTFKPWLVVSVLLLSMIEDREALDAVLLAEARAQKKQLVFFETLEQQVGVLETAITLQDLADTVERYDEMKRLMGTLLAAYRDGDHAALEKVAFDPATSSESQLEGTIYGRNRTWVPEAERLLQGDGAFVAVGVAHLVGPRSVLALLAQRGYRVRRLLVDGTFGTAIARCDAP